MSDSGEDWSDYVFCYENDDNYDCSLNIIDEYTPMYDEIENKYMRPIKFADLPKVKKVFNKSNVNVTNRNGFSALMIAILHSSSEIVDYLINECKADIKHQNDNGDNIYHILADRGDNKNTSDAENIFNILKNKDINIKININHKNIENQTPLTAMEHYSWRNDEELIKLYLENGAKS